MRAPKNQLCYLCGTPLGEPTSKDHIPLKALFPPEIRKKHKATKLAGFIEKFVEQFVPQDQRQFGEMLVLLTGTTGMFARPGLNREKGLSPRRASKRALLPHSPKRTQVRLKSLLELVWRAPDVIRTHGRPLVQEYRLRLKRP